MEQEQFIEELDQILASLRRLIVKAAGARETGLAIEIKPPVVTKVVALPDHQAQIPSAPKPATPPPAPVEYNGVAIDFVTNTVTFCRERVTVSRRHAQAIAVLARAMPNVMPRDAIVARAWPDLATSSGYTMLSQSYQDIRESIAKIGLKLNDVPRFGFALCVADDEEG